MPSRPGFDRQRVADVIIECLTVNLPLAASVAELMDCDLKRATYMIRSVREHGLLGRPPHHPARATIHRGSAGERSWLVCQHCTTHWPCAPSGIEG